MGGYTLTLSISDTPGNDKFIINNVMPYNWKSANNDNLWQGVSGTNNPCPSGFRIPTQSEFQIEYNSWNSHDAAGAFSSHAKFVMAGSRTGQGGYIDNAGTWGLLLD